MRLVRRWFSHVGTSPLALRLHVEHNSQSDVQIALRLHFILHILDRALL